MTNLSIGRNAENQIVITDSFVSRQHARLSFLDNGQVLIKDLGSSNGTFVNGKKIAECYLKHGDTVKCASVTVNWQQYIPTTHNSVEKAVMQSSPVMENFVKLNNDVNNNIKAPVKPMAPAPFIEPNINAEAARNHVQPNFQSPPSYSEPQMPVQQNIIIVGKAKSVGMAAILAFFFGPLGLLYASVAGGIIMFIITIPIAIVTLGVGLLFINPICCIWAIIAANNANSALQNSAGSYINNNFQR